MATPCILVVDDEASIRRTLREILEYEDFEVEEATTGDDALGKIRQKRYDLVLLDIKMPGRDGMEVLETVRDEVPEQPVVMISGHATIETAVEATRLGALDVIEKPPDLNRLLLSVRGAMERGTLEVQNRRLRQAVADMAQQEREGGLTPILGDSPAISQIKQTIERVAPTEARVLITGEPGTGKELVAKWIHHLSPRKEGPLVEVNCAAIPGELIESELFGHEKGAFTGATKQRLGKFEQADGGTIFLDEIGDMHANAQAKVLRALQESEIQRVGGDRTIPVNVRVLAATNKDLLGEMEEGGFRSDLYHRLSVILIHVPPLRERRGDVPILAASFADRLAKRNHLPPRDFGSDALEALKALPWPGNVRELGNVVERLLILSAGDTITADDVRLYVHAGAQAALTPGADRTRLDGDGSFHAAIDRFEDFTEFRDHAEKAFISRKLDQHDWNVSQTAETIGIQRSHLYNKLNKYDLKREDAA